MGITPLCFHHSVVIVPYQQASPFSAVDTHHGMLFTYKQCFALSFLSYYDLFIAALSHPYLQHSISCMHVCSYMMEYESGAAVGSLR